MAQINSTAVRSARQEEVVTRCKKFTMHFILIILMVFVKEGETFSNEPTVTPIDDTPMPPPSSPCEEDFDFKKEEDGKFSGPWDKNTLRYFNRSLGAFKICFNGVREFLYYVDQQPNNDTKPLQHGDPISFDFSTYCGEYAYYLRDCRSNTTKELGDSRAVFIRPFNSSLCGLHDCLNGEANATYPLNLDAIWQMEVPEGYGAVVVIYRLEIEQAENGACKNDYITVYGDSDPKSPTKMCGDVNSQQFAFTDGTTREVTVKFQSNHENNEGHFKGGIYVLRLESLNGSGSGSSVTDSVTTRRRRTLYNGLSRTADNPRGIMMADNGKDRDVEEGSEILTEKTLNDYMPIVNGELEDEVVDCFRAIVSHGYLGAQKYLNSLAHPVCQLLAKEFEKNGYVSPDL